MVALVSSWGVGDACRRRRPSRGVPQQHVAPDPRPDVLSPACRPHALQVQIIRIQLRVPEYGWTTQKVFHLLNFLVCGLRSGVFAFRAQVQDLPSTLVQAGLLDLPGK